MLVFCLICESLWIKAVTKWINGDVSNLINQAALVLKPTSSISVLWSPSKSQFILLCWSYNQACHSPVTVTWFAASAWKLNYCSRAFNITPALLVRSQYQSVYGPNCTQKSNTATTIVYRGPTILNWLFTCVSIRWIIISNYRNYALFYRAQRPELMWAPCSLLSVLRDLSFWEVYKLSKGILLDGHYIQAMKRCLNVSNIAAFIFIASLAE